MHAKTEKYRDRFYHNYPGIFFFGVELHYEKLVIYQIFKTVFDHFSKH